MSKRRALKPLVFSLLTLVLLAAVIDLMAGVAGLFLPSPQVRLDRVPLGLQGSQVVVAHPYRSYMLKPGQSFEQLGQQFRGFVVNRYGHLVQRDVETALLQPPPPRERRLLFIGGSTTFQNWGPLVGDLMQRRAADGVAYRSITAGTGGYTSMDNVVDLATSGLVYRPDLVVAYLPVNDVTWAAFYDTFRPDYLHMRTPLGFIDPDTMRRVDTTVRGWPFTLRLLDIVVKGRRVEEHLRTIDLAYYTVKPGALVDSRVRAGAGFLAETAEVVASNIANMWAMCRNRNIPFLLVTQKLFPSSIPIRQMLTPPTRDVIARALSDPRLAGLPIVKMDDVFPNEIDGSLQRRVAQAFPGVSLDWAKPVAYDSIHMNEHGVYAFALVLHERIDAMGMNPGHRGTELPRTSATRSVPSRPAATRPGVRPAS